MAEAVPQSVLHPKGMRQQTSAVPFKRLSGMRPTIMMVMFGAGVKHARAGCNCAACRRGLHDSVCPHGSYARLIAPIVSFTPRSREQRRLGCRLDEFDDTVPGVVSYTEQWPVSPYRIARTQGYNFRGSSNGLDDPRSPL